MVKSSMSAHFKASGRLNRLSSFANQLDFTVGINDKGEVALTHKESASVYFGNMNEAYFWLKGYAFCLINNGGDDE